MSPQSFIVYRDILGAPSEIGFLRRQYVGFSQLIPIWIARKILPRAADLRQQMVRLGDYELAGILRRLRFRYFGYVPPLLPFPVEPVIHAQFARGGALALPIARAHKAALVVTLHGGDVSKQKNWRRGRLLATRWPELLE